MNTSTLPFALDYGLENGPLVLAKDQTNDEFVKSITDVKFDYDYSSVEKTYDTRNFFEELADETSQSVSKAGDAVWDTATGTWKSVKAGVVDAANAIDDAQTHLFDKATGVFDGLLFRLIIVFVVLVGGLYVLGKSGVIKDAAKFIK